MVYDAVKLLVTVVKELHAVNEIQPITMKCKDNVNGWAQGEEILAALDLVSTSQLQRFIFLK